MEYLDAENALLREGLRATRIGLCIVDANDRVVQTAGDFAERLGSSDRDMLGSSLRLHLPNTLLLPGLAGLLGMDGGEVGAEGHLRGQNGAADKVLLFQARTATVAGARFRIITMVDLDNFGATRDRMGDLQDTLQAIAASVVLVDAQAPDLPIAYVNRRFEQLTGYTARECIGRNCRFLQGPDTDPAAVEAIRRAIGLRQATQVVLRNYRKNGDAFDNELFLSPIFDAEGRLRWILGVARERRERALSSQAAA
ncbi:PAS domain-containing protein [Luteibacter aegosomaticola]|uniref:PAS domain-containing protein n=1 Tax=Luteibacter aegosomaticola TaxID=2911538 RepID=UPI001FFAB86E|nr:PAS domain-containing protein [Luteibacter aegosomaticola]UPG88456.1 PAS domain-containing protein [Luteibacter aegosomaticola]